MPNDPLIEKYVEKYIQEFEKEPVCKHGFARGHYICEPHDYPHVLGNRFGKDCETCNPPPKPTLQNKKSFLRTSLKEYGDKRVGEYKLTKSQELLERVSILFIDFSKKSKGERLNMDDGDIGFMHGRNDTLDEISSIIKEVMK